MKKIWSFIKKVLKRFFPATVHILMREVNGLHGAMAAREANLSHQLGVAKAETQSLMKQIEEQQARRLDRMEEQQARRLDRMEEQQGKRLDRLSDLFESANRENLRLFFDAREERKEMDARYAQLAEEMKKLQTRQAELERKLAENQDSVEKKLGENQSAVEKKLDESQSSTANKLAESQTLLMNGQKRLEETVSAVRKASVEGARSASESVWADIFNQTISNSTWLIDKTFAPGRWAVGYPYLYVMYRVLNEKKPKRILELGLGQSTRMIAQYAAAHEGVEHYVIEQDEAWTAFFCKENKLGENTHVLYLPVKEEPFLDDDKTLVYTGFEEAIQGMRFDFISCDGPAHSRSDKYRRVEVIKLIPDYLEESFCLMLDDYDVKECRNTWELAAEELKEASIPHATGFYAGQKTLAVVCSENNAFLCSL